MLQPLSILYWLLRVFSYWFVALLVGINTFPVKCMQSAGLRALARHPRQVI
jgi:hypothetical protein